MRELYQRIHKMVEAVDFDRIWEGFHSYSFALYNGDTVWLKREEIPYDPAFRGDTCILWKGEWLAIWRVEQEEEMEEEELAAGVVHEMFHAFQKEMGESRYPDDFKLLYCPMEAAYFSGKYEENRLLARAVKAGEGEGRELLKLLGAYRRERELLAGVFIREEYKTETLEGMAEYAGLMALKQLDTGFFQKKLDGYAKMLTDNSAFQFDIRRISYITGTLGFLALSRAGIDWYHKIGEESRTVWELAAPLLGNEKVHITPLAGMEKLLREYEQNQKEQLQGFFSERRERVKKAGRITGYDPMNMVKYKRLILCTHFVGIILEEEKKALVIQGPVVIQLKEENGRDISCYYC